MKFWRKRKTSSRSKGTALSLEKLEDRAMMAVIPLASGQTAVFHDADGTEVKVKLAGPGEGAIELVGGVLTGAAIDTLSLTGTTGQTKLKISTRGGSVSGTTINDVVIDNALNELGALKHFKGKKVWLTGQFTADGDIDKFLVRSLGNGAAVDVTGDVGRFKAESLANNAQLDIAGTLREFVAKLLNAGSVIEANQLDMLKVKQQATGAAVNVGAGGLARAKLGWVYNSSFTAQGVIGDVVVKGDAIGAAFASNIDKGSDDAYGTIDDFVIDNLGDGYIQSVRFRGLVGATGDQRVKIVSSGEVGNVHLNRTMVKQGTTPMIWSQAASSNTPLSIIQASVNATGFSDDEIYVAVFGQSIPKGSTSGPSYYLSPSPASGPGVLTTTTGMQTGPTTPDLVTLPSYSLSDWKDATQAWGSDLVFPTPPPNTEWTGRIVISAGVPVQAQVAANGTISAPSASDPTDPSTGTFYDFVEFTVTSDANGNPTVDADTSQVDSFGMPLALQFFQANPTTTQFNGAIDPGTNDILGVVDTTGLAVGQYVTGTGIPAGAVITAISPATSMNPSIVSLNVLLPGTGNGPFTAYDWPTYDSSFTGTATAGSATLTNVSNLNSLVLNNFLGTGQPVIAAGVLPIGATIVAYDIDAETITLSQPASTSTPAMGSTTFVFNAAGPVGVAAPRDEITSLVNTNGLTQFLHGLVQGGNNQARPFLLSTAPFIANGPVPMDGASSGAAPIVITTAGAGTVSANNVVEVDGVLGNTAANGVFEVASQSGNTFTLGSLIANGTYTSGGAWASISPYGIISVSSGTSGEVVITASTTGLSNGDTVVVAGVAGNTGANGTFTVSNVGGSSFTLTGSTNAGNYTVGGYWYKQPTASTPVTGASSGAISISTGSTGSLQANDFVVVSGVGGNTAANGVFQVGTVTTNTSFELGGPLANGGYNSLGTWSFAVTDAAPDSSTGEIIITTANTTGLAHGDLVEVTGVQGNTAANNVFYVSDVTTTTFKLVGSQSGGAYTFGGTWKEYVPGSRLVSPKDLVESLASPQDLSQLNNYYNELIDDFFLNYYTGTINGQTGGGNTFNLVSTAYNQSPLTYSGSVQQVTINNPAGVQQYSGYALQLQDSSGADPTVYNIIYPFTASNAPSPEIYSPLFGTAATPEWLIANNQQFESASQMIFACDALFADNVERIGIDIPAATSTSNPSAALGDLENSIAAAFNRGIIMNDPSSWNDTTQWFPTGGKYNYWTEYWHQDGLTYGDLAYAFPYDDKFGASTNLEIADVGLVQITLGNWTNSLTKTAATMAVTLDSTILQPIAQQGPATFDVSFTNFGPTPTGTVALFMDGIPLNQYNNSSNPPVQLLTLSSGAASLSVTLPATGDAGNAHTYTVTAIYSGDDNYLPTIASMQLQIAAT